MRDRNVLDRTGGGCGGGKWWREEMRCYQHQVDGAPALEHGGRGERARVGNTHAHASTREY